LHTTLEQIQAIGWGGLRLPRYGMVASRSLCALGEGDVLFAMPPGGGLRPPWEGPPCLHGPGDLADRDPDGTDPRDVPPPVVFGEEPEDVCGPDVTDALERLLRGVETDFSRMPGATRRAACS